MQRAGVLGCLYAVLVLALALLEQRKSLPVPRSLQFVGDISYTVYLSHILVLSVLGRLWSLAGASADSWLDNFIVLFVMLVAVITYGWVGYRLVERPTIGFSHRLRTRWLKRA
jgi:peptidoglycan/LPS O-acetylase OafA/YrhL